MSKIRIGFDTRDLHFAKTGTRTFTEELLNEIRSDIGVELIELTSKSVVKPKGVFSKLFAHYQFIMWKVFTLPILAKRHKINHLICPDYVAPFIFLGKIKTYPVFHGCNIWELPQNYNSIWRWYFSKLALKGERKAHKVLTVSKFSKARLSEVLDIESSKIKVIPIGAKNLRNTLFSFSDRPIPQEYLLHVGVLDKRKNLPILIQAFNLLEDKSLNLILVGGQPSKYFNDSYSEIIMTIKQLNLESRVHLEGFISDGMLDKYYRHAKAYVFPSIYEGFGIPVLEAYLHELPVAASNIASLPEVVGKGGLLFDPKDIFDIANKIEQLLHFTNEELLELIREQRVMLSWYNWENTWKEIKIIIDEK